MKSVGWFPTSIEECRLSIEKCWFYNKKVGRTICRARAHSVIFDTKFIIFIAKFIIVRARTDEEWWLCIEKWLFLSWSTVSIEECWFYKWRSSRFVLKLMNSRRARRSDRGDVLWDPCHCQFHIKRSSFSAKILQNAPFFWWKRDHTAPI